MSLAKFVALYIIYIIIIIQKCHQYYLQVIHHVRTYMNCFISGETV